MAAAQAAPNVPGAGPGAPAAGGNQEDFLAHEAAVFGEAAKPTAKKMAQQVAALRGLLAPFAQNRPRVATAIGLLAELDEGTLQRALQWPHAAYQHMRKLRDDLIKPCSNLGHPRHGEWAAKRVLDVVSRAHAALTAGQPLDEALNIALVGFAGLGARHASMVEHSPAGVGLAADEPPALWSHGASPPSWARPTAAAVSARVREALPTASPALAAEYEALLADVAGGDDGERLLRAMGGEHGPRLLTILLDLASDRAKLAAAHHALAAAGLFTRHLATARSGTLPAAAGQPAVRSPLQLKYELAAQLAEEGMQWLLDSSMAVLDASMVARDAEENDGLSESRASSSAFLLAAMKALYRCGKLVGLGPNMGLPLQTAREAHAAFEYLTAMQADIRQAGEQVEGTVRSVGQGLEAALTAGFAGVTQQVGQLQGQLEQMTAAQQAATAAAAEREQRVQAMLQAQHSSLNAQIQALQHQKGHLEGLMGQASRHGSPARSLVPTPAASPRGAPTATQPRAPPPPPPPPSALRLRAAPASAAAAPQAPQPPVAPPAAPPAPPPPPPPPPPPQQQQEQTLKAKWDQVVVQLRERLQKQRAKLAAQEAAQQAAEQAEQEQGQLAQEAEPEQPVAEQAQQAQQAQSAEQAQQPAVEQAEQAEHQEQQEQQPPNVLPGYKVYNNQAFNGSGK